MKLINVKIEERDGSLFCPLCGSVMNKSTAVKAWRCSQKSGTCGELVLLPGTTPKPIFQKTEVILDPDNGGYGVKRITKNNHWRRDPLFTWFFDKGEALEEDPLK